MLVQITKTRATSIVNTTYCEVARIQYVQSTMSSDLRKKKQPQMTQCILNNIWSHVSWLLPRIESEAVSLKRAHFTTLKK